MNYKIIIYLTICLFFLVSCPSVPDTIVKNLSGKTLTVHQDDNEWIVLNREEILVKSRKSVWISVENHFSQKANFLTTIFIDTNETRNQAFIKELLHYPPPHKLVAVVMPDMKIYIQQNNLPKPFKNQPTGFPVQMMTDANRKF
jgi:hypothetical protein